jgi:hypothetical protein
MSTTPLLRPGERERGLRYTHRRGKRTTMPQRHDAVERNGVLRRALS